MSTTKEGITRRDVLVSAGTATAALGAVTLGASRAQATTTWDSKSDLVIVGSGIGGAAAAIVALEQGNRVTLVEKSPLFGGTSAKTGGVLWIPNNFTLKARGIEDNKRDCLRYLARFSYPERFNAAQQDLGLSPSSFALLEAFYDNASDAIDAMRNAEALELAEWRMWHRDRPATDYFDHAPENKVPAGRALGVVRPDGTLGDGVDMMSQLNGALVRRNATILLGHRATRLVLNDDGRAIGLEVEKSGKVVSLAARKGVIFASGGFAHNNGLLERYQRNQVYGSCSMPSATGDFINIAGAAGARLGNMAGAWRMQLVLEEALASPALAGGVFLPPGDSMFQVNKYGVRVVNEHRNYNDRSEVHAVYDPSRAEYRNQLMFMIYDQRTAEAFAGNYPLPEQPDAAPYVIRAESLSSLTAAIDQRLKKLSARTGGIRLDSAFADNLTATAQRFNALAHAGKDDDFQRGDAGYDREWHPTFGPMRTDTDWPANDSPNITMHPLRDVGPYYAIILGAGVLDTNGGPVVNERAQVLDTQDAPIPGLFGAGNCIASPSREAYWGAGCPLGLSLTYGYIAANTAHRLTPEEV